MTNLQLKKGDMIIAPPTMLDLRFRKTAILITYNDLDGSLGLCLNRPTNHSLSRVVRELSLAREINFPLYWGGPVNPGTVWLLHSTEWQMDNTITVNDGWSITSNEQMFHAIADGDLPRYFRFFLGFASWNSDQLESELRGEPPWTQQSSWLILEQPDAETLIEMDTENIWDHCLDLSGRQAVNNWL